MLIEYKPPSLDNLNYLIRGGHISLTKVYKHFLRAAGAVTQQGTQIQVNQAM